MVKPIKEVAIMRFNIPADNLCEACKFTYKCERYQFITENLHKIESSLLSLYKLDVRTGFSVDECDLFKLNTESDYVTYTIYNDDGNEHDNED